MKMMIACILSPLGGAMVAASDGLFMEAGGFVLGIVSGALAVWPNG